MFALGSVLPGEGKGKNRSSLSWLGSSLRGRWFSCACAASWRGSDLAMTCGRAWRRRYYDLFARGYDRFMAWHSGKAAGLMRRALVDRALVEPFRRALDLCCGTGAVAPALASQLG